MIIEGALIGFVTCLKNAREHHRKQGPSLFRWQQIDTVRQNVLIRGGCDRVGVTEFVE